MGGLLSCQFFLNVEIKYKEYIIDNSFKIPIEILNEENCNLNNKKNNEPTITQERNNNIDSTDNTDKKANNEKSGDS